ncbi:diguanylate cyclase [Tissierella carlieri]|uniref:Diguanylate cyclase n=1 Tax=Tissierella carlieri TaxID=689904 RepID=A0ABT1SCI8_9FIRM|nr:diguanylate cyclase [Tissierella carlieri]MCQ4924198.1 diguanylate cyclase [Tissierella carlieri]
MKIVDNRYKIEKVLEDTLYFETYKVSDLWEDDKIQLMKLYHFDVQRELINYFIDNFIYLSNINHKHILSSEKFNLVKTIDTKKVNMLLYYSISEYIHSPRLSDIKEELSLEEKLKVLLDIIATIDFLHFRGFTYKLLNPSEIFITKDRSVKLTDLATIVEKRYNSHYDDLTRYFISPEALINRDENDKKVDYFSLGVLIKYLLLQDFLVDDVDSFVYNEESILTTEQKQKLSNIIKQLTKRDFIIRDVNLLEIIDEISNIFNLNHSYDLIESRSSLSFNNKIIGREKEIHKSMLIDDDIVNGTNRYKGLVVNADFGVGKSRFLGEISHRLRLKGRDVYFIGIHESISNDLLDMSNILKQSMKDTPSELIEKYRNELSRILPELRLNIDEGIDTDLNQKTERFRLYNRIANYFTELSKEKIIYIIIDDIQKCNSNFVMLLDYLIKNVKGNNVFFIFSFEGSHGEETTLVKEKINEWKTDSYVIDMELHKLGLEEIGFMVKNILGMSRIPHNLASVLYKESQGNPRHIEYIIKHLYNIGEFYINIDGKWHRKGDSYSDLYFPADFDDAFKKQLDIIKKNYFDVFKVMAIFDDVLHKKILMNMLDIEQGKLEKDLDELTSLKLIDERLADWGYSYSINSSELKKLVYYEIPQSEKENLHRKASKVIQDFYGDDLDLVLEELIYHLIKSNQSEKALNIILGGFEKLENRYSTYARLLLEKAYNIAKDSKGTIKLKILEKLVDIYSLKGETEKGDTYLEDYQKEAERLSDFKHIIKGMSINVDNYYRKGQNHLAFKYIEDIEKISTENHIIEGNIIALSLRARIGISSGELKETEELLYKAITLSETYEIKTYLGTIYNRLGLIKALSGNINEAIENYEKSILYHQETDSLIEATRPINNIGTIYADHYANNEKAMENYRRGLGIATKFGVQEVEIIFLNNIAELYMRNYEFEKALKYMKEVKKGAIELQDLNGILIANINMGIIYLATSEYNNAYECYVYLKEIFETKQILDLELNVGYHNFLGEFYGYMGQWEKGIEESQVAGDLCKEFNAREYLKAQCRIIYFKFFKESYFNRDEIEKIRELYRKTELIQERKKALLYFSIISILHGDIDYALDLLEEDFNLINLTKVEFLDIIREVILYIIDSTDKSIEDLIFIEEKKIQDNLFSSRLFLNTAIGFKLYCKRKYKQAIKYLVEALDIIYRLSLKIYDVNLKLSYIKSRKGDLIKERIFTAVEKEYACQLDYLPLESISEENIYEYFDITPIIDGIGSEEFVRITQLEYYGEALDIKNTENLISRLSDDFRYNLDLILSYLGKESFAKKGFILNYNEKKKEYEIISSLDKKFDYKINEGILNLADRSKRGILINSNFSTAYNQRYREFLSNDIKGIMCVPIIIFEEENEKKADRRKYSSDESITQGYIYLETDKVFNRFDIDRLQLIRNLSYLIFINLENNKLRLMATTDKLTSTFTRKYYEAKFDQLISKTKSNNGNFSILMLDIDKFKNVNDNYGHRKGDEILASIGNTLKSTIRGTDIVARYGGEEFIVLLKNTTEEEAYNIAEKVRKNIESLKIQGIDHPVTVSIGISIYPQHSQFKEDLIEKADQALYHAKETGRNKAILWNAQMDNTINRVDKLAGILTGSMDEDNRNILALMDIIELIRENRDIKGKTFTFLGRLLETIDAEWATMMIIEKNKSVKKYFTRARFDDDWVEAPPLNHKIIDRVIDSKKGEFLIDWDNIDNVDSLSGLPNWQSIIVLPLIKNEGVKGILYISTSLKNKEFDFNSFNLSKNFGNIFAAIF